jgi:hypothetical protein
MTVKYRRNTFARLVTDGARMYGRDYYLIIPVSFIEVKNIFVDFTAGRSHIFI